MNEFTDWVQKQLQLPLPGRDAQFRMAPSFRIAIEKNNTAQQAAVMLLLYPKNGALHIVFMKRAEYQGSHSGQISFPGGKKDFSDPSLISTALRETEEEIGIPASSIAVLGQLSPLYIPVSGFEVWPFVGFVNLGPVFNICAHEVQYIIEFPVMDLLQPHLKKERPYSGANYSGTIQYFDIDGHEVWGATAMILNEFLEIIRKWPHINPSYLSPSTFL